MNALKTNFLAAKMHFQLALLIVSFDWKDEGCSGQKGVKSV